MDSNFAPSLALVLKSEGGWSDNPKDPGGATMKGVTLANFRRYVKADAAKADLKKISNDQIATVYRRFYWDAVAGAQLPAGVDYCVFDYGVNSGPSRGAKALQSVVNVVADGRIGPATLAALAKLDPHVVIDSICDQRMAFLKRLPTWDTFGRGWSDRVKSVRTAAHAMASAPVQKTVAVSLPPVTPPSVAATLPAEPASNATVLTVDGPKQDETTVVIAKTPQAPPAPAAPPSSKTGIIALGALIMTLLAGIARYVFGG